MLADIEKHSVLFNPQHRLGLSRSGCRMRRRRDHVRSRHSVRRNRPFEQQRHEARSLEAAIHRPGRRHPVAAGMQVRQLAGQALTRHSFAF